jgi:hypothetical protein
MTDLHLHITQKPYIVPGLAQALAFIDSCSLGSRTWFYRTGLPLDSEQPRGYGYHSAETVREKIGTWLEQSEERMESLVLRPYADVNRIENRFIVENGRRKPKQSIIRKPYGESDSFIFFQLDDVGDRDPSGNKIPHDETRTKKLIEKLRPITLFTVQTSRGSTQVWIVLHKSEFSSDEDRRAFRARLVSGCYAEGPASGAARCPGSMNFKTKHQDAFGDYPIVRLTYCSPRTLATRSALEKLGVLAPAHESTTQTRTTERREKIVYIPSPTQVNKPSGSFPRYEQYNIQKEDINRIDARIAWLAIHRWNRNPQDVFQYIYFQSPRASDVCTRRGEDVWRREVERTVNYAATGRHDG